MEHFIVSARKYRPQTFKDVVGQSVITNTLQNAIDSNHLAQAMLFTGPRGVGKTTCARILAKMINQTEDTPGDEDFAFNIFELDAASNNLVDDMRRLIDQVRIPPQVGKYKVYIIDEVHMLSQSAFNAFLKTLEEPPAHCVFILATTEKHKIIPTILSRCQIFDFKRITVNDTKAYLEYIAQEQGIEADEDALHIIAQKAEGAMRDALSIFDRIVTFTGKKLTRKAVAENLNVLDYDTFFEATDLIVKNKIPELLIQFNKTIALGFDGRHYITGLASHFRDLLVSKTPETTDLIEVGKEVKKQYIEQAKAISQEHLIYAMVLANNCDLNYKNSNNQRLLVELCLMQIASVTFDGEKKKDENYIIPPSFFKSEDFNKTIKAKKAPRTDKKQKESLKPTESYTQIHEKQSPSPNRVADIKAKPIIKAKHKVNSGLSLKSIQTKKEIRSSQKEEEINAAQLPSNSFTIHDLLPLWKKYAHRLERKGAHNLASILQIDTPKLNGTVINLKMPNDTNRVELEQHQTELLSFLRKQLQNYDISLSIDVDDSMEKQFTYTPQEKFNKLVKLNPNLEDLRRTFDLDI